MIFKNFDKFAQYIPKAAGTEHDAMKTFLEEAEIWLKTEVLGYPLYYYIDGISGNIPESTFDGTFDYIFDESIPPSDVVRAAEVVICLKAYLSAIPFVDLIQTPNGFAVVSNSNQAPASKERVERLIEFVKFRLSDNLDFLITFIFSYSSFRELWKKHELFERYTEIVYLTGKELMKFANTKVTFETLDSTRTLILQLQDDLSKYISPEYMKALFKKFRNCDMSAWDKNVRLKLQVLVGLMLQKQETYPMIEKLVNFMVKNIDKFPDFETSQTYKLKLEPKYKNRKSDTIFFFGG